MKIRLGFVTNSSSTSYTIVAKNSAPEGYFSLLDLLTISLGGLDLEAIDEFGALYFTKGRKTEERYFKIHDLSNYLHNAINSLEWKGEHLPTLEEELVKLVGLQKLDDDTVVMFADPWVVREGGNKVINARTNLKVRAKHKADEIEKYKKEIEFDKKQIEVLKEFSDSKFEDYVVMFLDIDNWGRGDIQRLIERSGATILKQETT